MGLSFMLISVILLINCNFAFADRGYKHGVARIKSDEENVKDGASDEKLKCGQRGSYISGGARYKSRIFNGFNVLPGEAPYHVRLTEDPEGNKTFCSGAILSPDVILTSVRCLPTQEVNGTLYFKVIYAVIGSISTKGNDGGKVYEIKDYRRHPYYRMTKKMINGKERSIPLNDLAILVTEVKMKFEISDDGFGSVNRVCLRESSKKHFEHEVLEVTGFGNTAAQESLEILQKAIVLKETTSKCAGQYKLTKEQSARIVCARGSSQGPCFGDFGAPLVRYTKDRYELVGIFSYHDNIDPDDDCSLTENAVYTRVSSYADWIFENLYPDE